MYTAKPALYEFLERADKIRTKTCAKSNKLAILYVRCFLITKPSDHDQGLFSNYLFWLLAQLLNSVRVMNF
jgi:hypothetical protein